MDRAKPGSIGVLSTGSRFVNEADGYHDYVTAMIAAAPEGEPVQSWQIADSRFVRRFPLGWPSRARCRCCPTCAAAT